MSIEQNSIGDGTNAICYVVEKDGIKYIVKKYYNPMYFEQVFDSLSALTKIKIEGVNLPIGVTVIDFDGYSVNTDPSMNIDKIVDDNINQVKQGMIDFINELNHRKREIKV